MFIYVVACWTFLDSLGNKLCRASVTCIVFCNKRNGAASLHRSCIKFRHSIAVVFQCLCETYLHETVRMLCSNGHAGIQSRVAGNWRWAAEQVQDTCGAFGRPRFLLASCELKLDTVRECKWTRDQEMVSMYWSMIICLLENHRFRIGTYAILLCGGAVIMKIFLRSQIELTPSTYANHAMSPLPRAQSSEDPAVYCHHIEYRCIHDKRFLGPHDLKCLKKLQPWQYYLDSFVLTHFSTWSISAKFWLNLWGVVEYYRQLVYVPFRFRPSQGSPNRR